MANLSRDVILSLIIAILSVVYGFLTNVIDDSVTEDPGQVHLLQENLMEKEVKERALEQLQEVFGLSGLGEKRHHEVPPQFMTDLYNNIADESGVTRRRNPYNAKVVRSFIERDNSLIHYFHFNISGLDVTENVLEAQLHLYRMRTPLHELHPTVFMSPSIIIRVYQVLDEQQLGSPDMHRLLSSHLVGAHSHGWEVFNVKEAVLDWMPDRRPNRGILVTCSTLFEQTVDVRFARRNEHHNSKQPILVLFDDDAKKHASPATPITDTLADTSNPDYYKYHNDPGESSNSSADPARQRRSLPDAESSNSTSPSRTNSSRSGNTSEECTRLDMFVDFDKIGWSTWIIAPKGYSAYHCKGHCRFPLGQSQRPTNHATVQSIVHKLNLAPDVGKPCCVPTSLLSVPILFYDDNDNIVLRMYEDMVADSCGCM